MLWRSLGSNKISPGRGSHFNSSRTAWSSPGPPVAVEELPERYDNAVYAAGRKDLWFKQVLCTRRWVDRVSSDLGARNSMNRPLAPSTSSSSRERISRAFHRRIRWACRLDLTLSRQKAPTICLVREQTGMIPPLIHQRDDGEDRDPSVSTEPLLNLGATFTSSKRPSLDSFLALVCRPLWASPDACDE